MPPGFRRAAVVGKIVWAGVGGVQQQHQLSDLSWLTNRNGQKHEMVLLQKCDNCA